MIIIDPVGGGSLSTVLTDTTLLGDGNETPLGVRIADDPANDLQADENGLFCHGTITVTLFKQGNGDVFPQILPSYEVNRKITILKLASNCADLSVTIGANNYDKTNLVDVVIPANVEVIINDLTIKAGYDNANAVITLI
jgi:hypothetical protein